jgi:hypothetical protein
VAEDVLGGDWGDELLPQHVRYLESRGVTPEVAKARGYYSATTKKELADVGFGALAQNPPALVIPVWPAWPTPEPVVFQIRPDNPRRKDGGRILKFEMPYKSTPHVDVHPATRMLVGDPRVPLLVTEGVTKADAAVARMGVCTVGLAGVWNWRGKNEAEGKTVLADWEFIAIEDREVAVVFDSDVMTKPEVGDALERLGAFLHRRGAHVRYGYLDAGDAGAKVGLDDWLVATGGGWSDLLDLTRDRPRTAARLAPPQLAPDPASVRQLNVLLDEVVATLAHFVAFSTKPTESEALGRFQVIAVALFVVLTYCFENFDCVPYLSIVSPTKRSGKTRVLEVLLYLACRAWLVAEITESTLFRKIQDSRPTVLIDEVDALWKKGSENTQGIRAILNVSYRSSGTVPRSVQGSDGIWHVEDFCPFGPKVLAGINTDKMPDTVRDRCIPIHIERRAKNQLIARYRERDAKVELGKLGADLHDWAGLYGSQLAAERPDLPDALNDRAQDIWEPLLAIADRAGGDWPELARQAALVLSGGTEAAGPEELLLAHILEAFMEKGLEARDDDGKPVIDDDGKPVKDRISTEALLQHLVARGDDSKWAKWWGSAVEEGKLKGPASRLARMLKPHGIAPKKLRISSTDTARGYLRADFVEVWERYGFHHPHASDNPPAENVGTMEHPSSDVVLGQPTTDADQDCSVVPTLGSEDSAEGATHKEPDIALTNGSVSDPDTWIAEKPW